MPFSDEAWAALDALGEQVDADLVDAGRAPDHGRRADLRVDRRLSRRRNGTRRRSGRPSALCADELIRRLRDRFAPGGFLHYGQGKWYPGEPLPRWAFALYWRADGKPIWQQRRADRAEEAGARPASIDDAHASLKALAGRLGIAARTTCCRPSRIPPNGCSRKARCRHNIDPSDPKIDDPVERAPHHARVRAASAAPAGYVLPVQRWSAQASGSWISEIWQTRRAQAFPGAGRFAGRLPPAAQLAAPCQAGRRAASRSGRHRSRIAARCRILPAMARAFAGEPAAPSRRPRSVRASKWPTLEARQACSSQSRIPVRTALAVEPRDGRLCVFMPPVEKLEDYLELLAAVEATAAELNLPVHDRGLSAAARSAAECDQGHARSRRDRGQHPSGRIWRDAVDITRTVYEEARLSRLGADKFMIDGRHTGTGGGNHVVLGGAVRGGQPVPAPARSAEEPDPLLAAASLAVLSVLRPVHRPDQPGAAHRRGAPRSALRTRNRAVADPVARCRRGAAAVAGRPPAPQSPGRRHRQHPSRRNLHRQAILAGRADRPARPRRIPLVRNAARRADEPGAAASVARAGRLVLARAAAWLAGALGHCAA